MNGQFYPKRRDKRATYGKTLRTPISGQTLLGQSGQGVFAFHGILQHAILGSGRVGVFQNKKDQRENGEVGGVHGEPIGAVEESPLLHPGGDMDDITRDANTSRRTGIRPLVHASCLRSTRDIV